MDKREKKVRTPSLVFASCILIVLLLWMAAGILLLSVDIRVLLIISIVVVAGVSYFYLGKSMNEIIESMTESVGSSANGLFFFIMIGMAVAVWMFSGCLPTIVYYGLDLLNPVIFLPMTFMLSSIFSLCTGSAWTTAGTIGVVCLGIGIPMGVPEAMTVGAVVSGAYFGDKMSPVSDSTNMAPLSAGTDVFTHIRAMLPITVPAYVISFIIYLVLSLGFDAGGADTHGAAELQAAIAEVFNVNIIVLLPLIIVLVGSVMRMPAIPTLMCGILTAVPTAMIFQKQSFGAILNAMASGVSLDIANPMVAKIVNRGGIDAMLSTLSLAIVAMAFGGLMARSGIFPVVINALVRKVNSPKVYPMITILTCMFLIVATGDNYVPLTLAGKLFDEAYDDVGLDRSMLSRNIEEGGTITAVLCPWASSAAYYAGVFGVPTLVYLPYSFLNILTIILGCVLPLCGLTLITKEKVAEKRKKVA